MKSLEQELVESKAKIENLTSTKSVVDNRSVSVSLKPKTEKVYISHFKRNNKENAYFARLGSIDTSLRGTLAKTFSHHTHNCEKAIWCLGSNQEGTN